jgi:ABC-type nitrate/sulfonate/bicarbonate transport system substrate-binding protein
VKAFYLGARFTANSPEEAADIASPYIGVNSIFIRQALARNLPNVDALGNEEAMQAILDLMLRLGYIDSRPEGFKNLTFLKKAKAELSPLPSR